MEVQVVASLIGIAGVTLSALLSGFGYFFKVRTERLKTTRQILFYLLEFRAHVLASSISPSELYDQYLRECQKYFDKKKIEGVVIPQQNQELMLGYFSNLIEEFTPEISQEFICGYTNTINEIAKERPILAFQLRGKDVVTKMVMIQSAYLGQLQSTELFTSDNGIGAFLQKQLAEVHANGLKEILNLLDDELVAVSKACGVIHYLKVRKITKNKVKPSTSFEDVGIEAIFDNLISELSQGIATEKPRAEING